MMTPVQDGYGLGLSVAGQGDSLWVSHSGGNHGYRALMVTSPTAGQGAVVLTNGDGGGVLTREIVRAVAAAYDWTGSGWTPQSKRSVDVDASFLSRYVGRYQGTSGQEVRVRERDGQLVIDVPMIGTDMPLVPASDRRFFATEFKAEVEFAGTRPPGADTVKVYLGPDRLWLSATRVR
jgi:hypothetical protein